jgi:hypothetical protein
MNSRDLQAIDSDRNAGHVPMPASCAKSTTTASRGGPRRAISKLCEAGSVSYRADTTPTKFLIVTEPLAVALERRLSVDHGAAALSILTSDDSALATASETRATTASSSEGGSPTLVSPCQQNSPVWDAEIHVQVPPMTPTSAPLSFSTFKFPPTPPSPARTTFVDDLMRADLYVAHPSGSPLVA